MVPLSTPAGLTIVKTAFPANCGFSATSGRLTRVTPLGTTMSTVEPASIRATMSASPTNPIFVSAV